MKFTVKVAKRALTDLEEIRAYIESESPKQALLYAAELRDRIVSLSHMPRRCPVAPEGSARGMELRHLIHGSYRILFTIDGARVHVVRVVHGARTKFTVGRA